MSDMSIKEAIEVARKMERHFQAFERIHEALKIAGVIEQRLPTLENARDKLNEEIAVAKERREEAQKSLKRAQAEAERDTKAAKEKQRQALVELRREKAELAGELDAQIQEKHNALVIANKNMEQFRQESNAERRDDPV